MAEAARHLHGAIDCAVFANRRSGEPPPARADPRATTRLVREITFHDEGGGRLRIDFHVNSALYKMVRNMVGLLLLVGDRRARPEDVPSILATRDRSKLVCPPAPAHGLTLESVYYDVGWGGAFSHPLHPCTKGYEGAPPVDEQVSGDAKANRGDAGASTGGAPSST